MLGLIAPGRSFRPSNIAGVQLWLDASVESSLGNVSTGVGGATNNGPVKYWADLSGNAIDASNAEADSVVPTLLTGNRNGLSVLRFDGGDSITTASWGAFPSKRGTLVCAINNRKATGYGTIAATLNNGSVNTTDWAWYMPSSGTLWAWYPTSAKITSAVSQGWTIMAVRRSSDTAIEYRVNGVARTQTDVFTNTQPRSKAMYIGAAQNGASINETGTFDLGEFAAYSRDLSDAELTTVERYLANKWGVTL